MASHQPRAGAMNFIFLLISLILLTAFVLEAESRPVQVNHLNVNDVKENKQVNDRKIVFPPTPFPQIPQLPFPPPPSIPQIPQLPFPPPPPIPQIAQFPFPPTPFPQIPHFPFPFPRPGFPLPPPFVRPPPINVFPFPSPPPRT